MRNIFLSSDLNGEPKWFYWFPLGDSVGSAIGPFETRESAERARQHMSDLAFLAERHSQARPDKWGWSEHLIGQFCLRTNGTAWLAHNVYTNRRVKLKTVIKRWRQL